MANNGENGETYRISCSLGEMSLTVEGTDENRVETTFKETWGERLDEASKMKRAIRETDPSHQ